MAERIIGRDARRTLAYVIVVLAGFWGFTSVQNAQDKASVAIEQNADNAAEAKTLAERVAVLTAQRLEDQAASNLNGCRIRNTAQRNGRDRFVRLFENFQAIVAGGNANPQATKNLARVTEGINLSAAAEDRDCNGDGVLTNLDYVSEEEPGGLPTTPTKENTSVNSPPTTRGKLALSAEPATTTTVLVDPTVTTSPPVEFVVPPTTVPDPVQQTIEPVLTPLCVMTEVLGLCDN